MRLETLDNLLSLRERNVPVVLVTDLADGHQVLWSEYANLSDHDLGPDAVDACREALRQDKGRQVETENSRLFLQVHNPPKRMLVTGAVHISQYLAPMATLAGFDVTIIDPRSAWATGDRFPGQKIDRRWPDEAMAELAPNSRTAVVTLTHDPKLDDPALECAIRSDAFYIGALGSRKTHGKRVQRLQDGGFSEQEISRICAPVGMDIGAVSPAEIAVSVLAEVTLALHGPRRKAE